MKVFISADMEGATGVVCEEEVFISHPEYQRAARHLHNDLKAALDGCRAAGAKTIILNDSHDTMRNIQLSDVEHDTVLIRGSGKPGYMLQGLDQTCDAAIFLAYHARAGTLKSTVCHTYSWVIHHVKINGRLMGEFGINALLCGYYGVPVVFISGDRSVVNEAAELSPNIAGAVVKEAASRHSAVCLPGKVTEVLIKNKVKEGLEKIQQVEPMTPGPVNVLEIEFKSVLSTEKVEKLPGIKIIDGYTVSYETRDYLDLYLNLQTIITLCWSSRLR
jgi:D-amino peptidase